METGLPKDLGNVSREVQEATRALIRNLSLAVPPSKAAKRHGDAFVPVTLSQWRAVLVDAHLIEQWWRIRSTLEELVPLASAAREVVSRQLPRLARDLSTRGATFVAVMAEIARFKPPGTGTREGKAADDLAVAALRSVHDAIECLEQGWDGAAWLALWTSAREGDAAVDRLKDALDSPIDEQEDAYERVLGLSTADVRQGSGLTSRARIAAAWARDPRGLDRRLHRQMRHLIDDSLPLNGKLRQHLTILAASDRPLIAHRAAMHARDLVTKNLKADLERTRTVIARHVQREPLMLSAFQGLVNAWKTYRAATFEGDQVRPLADLYKVISEGDVKLTSIAVLQLLGRQIPPRVTLSTIADLLRAERSDPLCSMLAAVVLPEWRNAIAHEEFHWDASQGKVMLGDQAVELDEMLDTALQARTICQGFEIGVAVSYAQNSQMNPWQVDENNEVTRCLDMLQVMGEVGQPVLDVQRRGTCMYMQVPNLSGGTMRTLLRALLRAAQVDKGITQWELRQEAERPALCIDQSAIQVALNLADGLWGTIDPLFFVELPLIAHAMSNAGEVADVSATTVLCLAAAHVAGERDRLAGSLAVGAEPAKAELLEAAGHICSGLRAAAVFIAEENACRRVERFVQVLAGECQWFAAAPPPALIRAFLPAERVLRRHAPAHVPWIGSQSVQKR